MDENNTDLARTLFAWATAMLEDAIEIAVAGQSPKAGSAELTECAQRPGATVEEINTIAKAAASVAQR